MCGITVHRVVGSLMFVDVFFLGGLFRGEVFFMGVVAWEGGE